MTILATVAARGGSKGLKNKNIKNLCGKPLVAYTIEQVKRWGGYDKFIVSTDSQEIADIALSLGAEVPFLRPSSLASDTASKLDALRHALVEAEKYYDMKFDAIVDLDATSPVRTVTDIKNIVKIFQKQKPDCVFSVVVARRNPYFNMVELECEGTARLCKRLNGTFHRRQDAPPVYSLNASLYVYKRKFLLDQSNTTPHSGKTLIYQMPQISSVDIDSELDFKFIEFLAKEGLVKL